MIQSSSAPFPFAPFPFAIVGFDLDGTVLDTSGDLAAAVNHALADAGRPALSVAEVTSMIGGGAKRMLTLALEATGGCDRHELERLHTLLLDYYEANIAVDSRPFPGAIDAINALAGKGVKIAMVTNKLEYLAEKLLRELGVRDRFDALVGGDTLGPGLIKPHRAPIDEMIRRCGGGQAAFVGDSIYDVTAARNAGVPTIACSFGFLTQPVAELGADSVIDTFAELIPALEAIGNRAIREP